MVKRVILTALFFIFATGIFGAFNKANAAAKEGDICTTTKGFPGTCTLQSECPWESTNTVWDNSDKAVPPCSTTSKLGCCGTNTASDSPCKFVTNSKQNADCLTCKTGVWTAIGCIPIDSNNPSSLITIILKLGLGLAGGIAFLLILFGGLQIMTSAGNPEQLNAGRELITSAIIGLILILFSVFLLQFIGINIIGIPGFISK